MHTILVVDDDKDLRSIVKGVLLFEGFQVLEATNGFEALECLKNEKPDLVILDLNMPEMNGIEAIVEINAINPSVPIIILTGERDMLEIPDALRLGAHYFMAKPPDFDELLAIINVALNRQGSGILR